jgi:hypothetical protein
LQEIYDPSVSIKTVFDYNVINVHVKGNLKLTGWDWSSSRGTAPASPWIKNGSGWAWLFNFGVKEPRRDFPLSFDYSMRALCVRDSGE